MLSEHRQHVYEPLICEYEPQSKIYKENQFDRCGGKKCSSKLLVAVFIRATLWILHKLYAAYMGRSSKNKMGFQNIIRMAANEDNLYFDSSII